MIPVRLTLQGLYSYQEKQIIDFTRLTRSHIFGIFGPVGSGKSAILEAISYALYGRTDRMNLSGDNRYYNMMNLKSNELLIEFIFTAGKQDTEYLAVVKSRRNSRQFEDVKAIEHTAYKKVNSEWTPVEVSSLESVIGLSYENFKRTIIIPQGRFQEFLQLGNKERTQMMKELFNLDKYELYYKVLSLESKNSQQIQNLEGRLKQLGEISLSQIEEREAGLAVLKLTIETKLQELALQQGKEMELRKLKDLAGRIKETENTLIRLKNQEPQINALEKSIGEYEYCQLNFKSPFETAEENSQKIAQFSRNIDEDDKALAITFQELSGCKVRFETARSEFEEREKYNRQADELLKIAKLNELRESYRKLTGSIQYSEKILKETLEGIGKLRLLQETLKENVRNWKQQYPDMSLLSDVREWHAILKQLESAKKETETEIKALNEEIGEIYTLSLQLWQEECFIEIPESQDFIKTWELLDNKRKGLLVLKDRLGSETEHLALQARLEEYATNLEEGKPCPLCGSLYHPLPLDSKNIKETLLLTRQQSVDCDRLIGDIELNQKKVKETESRIQAKKDSLKKLQGKLAEQDTRISLHHGQFKWDKYRDESELHTAYSLAEKIRSQIKEGETRLEDINKQLEENNQLKENNLHIIDEAKLQLTAIRTESVTLQQQIEILNSAEFANQSTNEIRFEREDLLKKYRDAETNYQQISNRLKDLQKNHDNIFGRLQANREALTGELKSQDKLNARIEEQLALSGFSSLSEIRTILSHEQDVVNDKKKVADYRQSVAIANRQLSSFQTETAGKNYSEDIHRQLINQINAGSDEITEKNQQQGKLESELVKMKTDLLAYTEMNEHMAALTARGEDIKTMKQLFKASGFVNYISTVYLQELCHAANERFYKLTRQKFSLEVTDDNNFQVRDFLNGGKVRNVKTLSGGQTFQAALSLSLALADSIQKITESNQNFFFLDEGFGSLDKESLAIVFDTLKSLRKENRIVGVISHVEEMQQEIDNYLKIVLDEERGSIIQVEPYGE
jgi:DNA repair protein SbcC/Rad50